MQEEKAYNKAMDNAFNYLSYSMRTKKEMIDYLNKREYDDDIIKNVIARLIELNYINDDEYIKMYISSRIGSKDIGRIKIKNELIKKGLNIKQIDIYLEEEYSNEKEIILGKRFVNKALNKYKGLFLKEKKDKILKSGIANGFNSSLLIDILNEIVINEEDINESEKQKEKIRRKIEKELIKNDDFNKISQKVITYFFNKGADIEFIKDVLDEYREIM